MFCVVMSTEYYFFISIRASHTLFLDTGSRLAVGSSMINNFASPIRAIAIDINLFYPELNFSTL